MSNPPPAPPPPPPLEYRRADPPAGRNRWWKVILRIFVGIFAGFFSAIAGALLSEATHMDLLFFMPAVVVFTLCLVLTIKYRRFGYLSGFLLAPFIAFAGLVVLLFIICGGSGHP